ncbi:MAG: hypothetical protein R3B97_10150 [Dehalococcoidia bacterium]|nr:hypothetical protein [Dehalococcoidia bacterium]MCB9484890.1 hypothetical protein [Thermoflexaceae bacterium]
MKFAALAAPGVLTAALLAGCGGDETSAGAADSSTGAVIDPGDGGNYAPVLDPADFVGRIDNVYLPFRPGNRWVYESEDGTERIEVEVLSETRVVMGITATVVRDTVYEDGDLVEDTWDWYAQDKDGNVWYLGEDTAEYEDGKIIDHNGAWEAGVDGALPGIAMWAQPVVNKSYRQEYSKGEAEDLARIEKIDGKETVQGTAYEKVVVIREWTPLDPEFVEEKYYAPGVGVILEVKVKGGDERVKLVSFTPAN